MKTSFIAVILPILIFGACAASMNEQLLEQTIVPEADSLYGDLSEKEECVLNYSRSCSEKNIDKYTELFTDNCEFILVMEEERDLDADLLSVPTFHKLSLQDDLNAIKYLFEKALEIRFDISEGTWARLDSLSGESCIDCWETTREYSLLASLSPSGEDGEAHNITGRGRMQFMVSPVDGKWKIFKHIDEPMKKQDNE